MTHQPSAATFAHFETKPLSPSIGAEIHGLDLSRELDDHTVAEVRRALLD